jgi:hypothetical protein
MTRLETESFLFYVNYFFNKAAKSANNNEIKTNITTLNASMHPITKRMRKSSSIRCIQTRNMVRKIRKDKNEVKQKSKLRDSAINVSSDSEYSVNLLSSDDEICYMKLVIVFIIF